MDYRSAYEIQKRAYDRLLKLAIRTAATGPARIDRYTRTVGIPKGIYEDTIAELDSLGVKWRELRPDGGKKLPRKGENGNG